MKKILLLSLVSFIISCSSFKTYEGTYSVKKYGEKLELIFAKSKTATVIIDGEAFAAKYFEKNGIIEVWQNRKTPAIFLRKLNKNEFMILDEQKNPTEHILKKIKE